MTAPDPTPPTPSTEHADHGQAQAWLRLGGLFLDTPLSVSGDENLSVDIVSSFWEYLLSQALC